MFFKISQKSCQNFSGIYCKFPWNLHQICQIFFKTLNHFPKVSPNLPPRKMVEGGISAPEINFSFVLLPSWQLLGFFHFRHPNPPQTGKRPWLRQMWPTPPHRFTVSVNKLWNTKIKQVHICRKFVVRTYAFVTTTRNEVNRHMGATEDTGN